MRVPFPAVTVAAILAAQSIAAPGPVAGQTAPAARPAAAEAPKPAAKAKPEAKPAAKPEAKPAAKPAPLTEARLQSFIAVQKDLAAIPDSEPEASARAKQEAIVKAQGFAGTADYEQVSDGVSAVMSGLDETGKYVGAKTLLRQQIAQVKADKKIPAKDKAAILKELNEALAAPDEAPQQADIDLVVKHHKAIQAALPQDAEDR